MSSKLFYMLFVNFVTVNLILYQTVSVSISEPGKKLRNATRIAIVNGVPSLDRPFYVKVVRGRIFCGGAIIDKYWVLTAAHCVESAPAIHLHVQVSAYFMPQATLARKYQIKKVYVHPSFKLSDHPLNNIALLQLSAPIKGKIRDIPMCFEDYSHGTRLATCGMGSISGSSIRLPTSLREAFFTESKFESSHPKNFRFCRGDNICTNRLEGDETTSSCFMDDGNPLYTLACNSRTPICLYGIASHYSRSESYSKEYCEGDNYFASVPHAYDWIRETVMEF